LIQTSILKGIKVCFFARFFESSDVVYEKINSKKIVLKTKILKRRWEKDMGSTPHTIRVESI